MRVALAAAVDLIERCNLVNEQEIPVLPAADDAAPKGKSRVLLIVVVLVLLGGGGAAAWHFLGGGFGEGDAKAEFAPPAPPVYVALDPPFVVNFEAEKLVRFLQVTVQVMSRDPETAELIRVNDPVVRNDLLLLFGGQKYATLATREGKERLREEALTAVRRVVAAAGGRPELVEAVYFTSFVMQ